MTFATNSGGGLFHGSNESEVPGVRDGVPPRGAVRLRPLLRPARGRLRPHARLRPRQHAPPHPGRPAEHLALRRLPPAGAARRPAHAHGPAGRLHAADPRRPPRRAPRPARGVGQERRGQPDALVQGPRRLRRRRTAPGSSASRCSPAPRPATSPTRSPPTAPRSGMESYVFIPADLEEQKILATGVYGTNLVKVRGNYDDVNRLCTELSGERDWAFVNVNMRPYYAEGSKTLAYEIAEQLGWQMPDRVVAPIASGSLYTKIGKGFQEWLDLGLVDGDAPVMNGAQAARLLAGRHRLRGGHRRLPPGQARHDRQVARHRQPGRRPVRDRAGPPQRRRHRLRHRRRDPRGHPPARRDDRHLHRDRRRHHDRGAQEARRPRRHRPRRARRRRHHRRGPQDPRRGPRHVHRARDRRRATTSSSSSVEGVRA